MTETKPTICRHCSKSKVNRPRGLCWSCYYNPGVKEMYPSTSKFAHRGTGNFTGIVAEPVAATEALPGTEEKIRILAARVARRESLWHRDDAPAPLEVSARRRNRDNPDLNR